MFHEVPQFAPLLPGPEAAAKAAAAVVPGPPHPVPPPTPEQIRAAEAVFAAQEQESSAAAGLLGLWTGVMLLNDLAQEHFSPPAGEIEAEEEREPRVKK
jgi:hypothetical protein